MKQGHGLRFSAKFPSGLRGWGEGGTSGSKPPTECSLSGGWGAVKHMGKMAVKTSGLSTGLNPVIIIWSQKSKSQKKVNDVVIIYIEI